MFKAIWHLIVLETFIPPIGYIAFPKNILML